MPGKSDLVYIITIGSWSAAASGERALAKAGTQLLGIRHPEV